MPYKDPQKQAKYFANYRAARRSHYVDLSRRWRLNNPQEWEQNQAAYRATNRERIRKNAAERFATNRSGVLEINRRWYQRNRAKVINQKKDYAKLHPEISVIRASRRRCRLTTSEEQTRLIADFVKSVKRKKTFVCHWCGEEFSTKIVHFDHVVALVNNGAHSLSNLCTSCPGCNLSKSHKPLEDHAVKGQTFLPL